MISLIDYMISNDAADKMWDTLIESIEAKRFAKFMLRDLASQIDKLDNHVYNKKQSKPNCAVHFLNSQKPILSLSKQQSHTTDPMQMKL